MQKVFPLHAVTMLENNQNSNTMQMYMVHLVNNINNGNFITFCLTYQQYYKSLLHILFTASADDTV